MEDRQVYSALTLAGVTPFLACALLPAAGIEAIEPFGRLDELASNYGMAILCFLTGIHWATQLYAREKVPFNLFTGSNVVFLAVWIAYVASSLTWALATQPSTFNCSNEASFPAITCACASLPRPWPAFRCSLFSCPERHNRLTRSRYVAC